jgi:hypothetical protein
MFQAMMFFFNKTKAHFLPNNIFISFVNLTLDDMAASKGGLGPKWPCDTQKKSKNPQIISNGPFLDIVYGRL